MKPTLLPLIIALALSILPASAASPIPASTGSPYTVPFMTPQTQWAASSLQHMQTIHAGMTRAQLMKVFATEGRFSTRETQTFVYQGCPCFKVRVQFTSVGKRDKVGQLTLPYNPADKIKFISQPFLAWPVNN